MTKKFFRGNLIIASVVLLASFAIIMGSLYGHFSNMTKQQMRTQLDMAVIVVEELGLSYINQLHDNEYRLTLIAPDGAVLADTSASPLEMDNHSSREEIIEAFLNGKGEASRFSETLMEKTIYFAERLSDGSVLRISVSQLSLSAMLMNMFRPFLFVVIIALILSAIIAGKLSKSIIAPLNQISFDRPMENVSYPELAPVLRHIEAQNREINMQKTELIQRQREFKKITENLRECLILLDASGKVLNLNNSAKTLFSVDERSIGKDFINIDRTPELNHTIQNSMTSGVSETYFTRNGKDFLFRASKITTGGVFVGTAIVVIDETEKLQGERARREFTANVSHELKTPLQSIIGSADLIENGLVKKEDLPRFISHIKTDAERLVTLINDILRLSLLDEGQKLSEEKVNLTHIAKTVINDLQQKAMDSSVNISFYAGEWQSFDEQDDSHISEMQDAEDISSDIGKSKNKTCDDDMFEDEGYKITDSDNYVYEKQSTECNAAVVQSPTQSNNCSNHTPYEIITVPQLVYEIMYNLCENAIKYNRENGSVILSLAENLNSIEITVEDTGIGIAPEHHHRIFERFYRVDKSHSRQTGGTGLGLSIVKNSVKYLGGTIHLESTPDIGTTIKVTLPKNSKN